MLYRLNLYPHSVLLRFKLEPIYHSEITFKITLFHRPDSSTAIYFQSQEQGSVWTSPPLASMLGMGFTLKHNQITL